MPPELIGRAFASDDVLDSSSGIITQTPPAFASLDGTVLEDEISMRGVELMVAAASLPRRFEVYFILRLQ
jgi:hypothetical protein